VDLKILENVKALKVGHGVISKSALTTCVFIAGGSLMAWATHDVVFSYVVLGILAISFCINQGLNVYFVKRHPEQALLEGMEIVDYHRMQAEIKGLQLGLPETAITTSPARELPPAPDYDGDDAGQGIYEEQTYVGDQRDG
jgi:hypothetical protein